MGLFSGVTEKKYQSQIVELEQKHTAQITEIENRFKSQLGILEKENIALKESISEKSNAVQELSKKIDELEKQLSVYDETFSTLKDIKASKEEEAYIAHQLRVLDLMRLVNAGSTKNSIDMADRQKALDERIRARKELEKKIMIAIQEEQEGDNHAAQEKFSYEINKTEVIITGFKGFDDEGTIEIPDKIDGYAVTKISDKAFYNLQINQIILPDTIEVIGAHAFSGCSKLTKVKIPSKLKEISHGCFCRTALRSIRIPDGVTRLNAWCFQDCNQLTSVTLGENVEQIAQDAFRNTSITKIIMPKSMHEIEHDAFSNINKTPMEVAFLGKEEVFLGDRAFGINTPVIYCLPNSKVIKSAKDEKMPVKPLSEFTL